MFAFHLPRVEEMIRRKFKIKATNIIFIKAAREEEGVSLFDSHDKFMMKRSFRR